MFTRCPECLAVHTLNASALANSAGTVCCGKCNQEFSALDHLFDYWPDADSAVPGVTTDGKPIVLGAMEPASEIKTAPDQGVAPEEHTPKESDQTVWLTMFILLLFITVSNLAWTFRDPLMSRPEVRKFLVDTGVMEPGVVEPFRDTARFHLVSRGHASTPGTLWGAVAECDICKSRRAEPTLSLHRTDADRCRQSATCPSGICAIGLPSRRNAPVSRTGAGCSCPRVD